MSEQNNLDIIMANKIKCTIKCDNIAPLASLNKSFEAGALSLGIFAGNGSGKTYLSRMFRLMEGIHDINEDEAGGVSTDVYLSFDQSKGEFGFTVVDKNGNTVEDVSLVVEKGKKPAIPQTHYIYHTFNQDYVEENIRALDFEKDSSIEGFILGKAQIDLSVEEAKLKKIVEDGDSLKAEIENSIKTATAKIDSVRDIKRISEYNSLLRYEVLTASGESLRSSLPKTVDEYLDDYDKLKSIPENIASISQLEEIKLDYKIITELVADLKTEYSLSSFAEDFKNKVKTRQHFIEEGLRLYGEDKSVCPFCGRSETQEMLNIIDQYSAFLQDSEALTIKKFQQYKHTFEQLRISVITSSKLILQNGRTFDDYKTKYVPSCDKLSIGVIDTASLSPIIDTLNLLIDEKIAHIDKVVSISEDTKKSLQEIIQRYNCTIHDANKLFVLINKKLQGATNEMRETKRSLCKATYDSLLDKNKDKLSQLLALRKEYSDLRKEIEKKKETEKISKKKKVAETIRQVLDYFFSGKYTLDEETFQLYFNSKALEKGRVKHVLSEGEKNIIAFAYYLGDCHMRLEKQEDYNRLFFIIDDPISSMDFTYVYTMSGVIRDIKKIIPDISLFVKMLVLTHNNDFMRILTANNILDTVLLLKNSVLSEFNDNYTVPYINHLIDIYRIARKGGKATHTTANSIRHIIETLDRFCSIDSNENSVKEYISTNIPSDKKSYTYINDLSHGGWRSEQEPMNDADYQEVCEAVIAHIEKKYPKQIEFCKSVG